MWIEMPSNTTRRLQRKAQDAKGKEKTFVAEFNHNGRAEVTKACGELLMKEFSQLKAVKDGGPPLKAPDEAETTVTEEESTDGE